MVLESSSWLKKNEVLRDFMELGKPYRHFIFAGGDNIVEIISDSEPQVSTYNETKSFEYRI